MPQNIKLIYKNVSLKDPQNSGSNPERNILRLPCYDQHKGFDLISVDDAHAIYTRIAAAIEERNKSSMFDPILTPEDFARKEQMQQQRQQRKAKETAAATAHSVIVSNEDLERCLVHMRSGGVADRKVWVCPIAGCEIRLYDQDDFKWHLSIHNSHPRCVCPYCNEYFNLKVFLDYHIILDHRGFEIPRFADFDDIGDMSNALTTVSERLSRPDMLSMFMEAERKHKNSTLNTPSNIPVRA